MEFPVDWVSGWGSPPPTGTAYAFQIPDRFDETRSFWRSGAQEAPKNRVFL
jgi:hypothetical protein